ncbi:DUF6020 family protein [Butyrivibrio sp. WCE2006]|uniref:DUF6020 family protein n=1 Tax=Butyrivibrio sp. WCE2006 TaxID=1410611 RepID=UPI0005D20C21|nr:DUF6020 family protein [Butyrivibrio sp. WCE2006]
MKVLTKIPIIFFFLIFAMVFAITPVYAPESSSSFNIVLFIFGIVIVSVITYINSKVIINLGKKSSSIPISDKHFFIASFGIYAVIGFLMQLVFFPATLSNDTIVVIRGGMGVSGQHPWMYIALLRGIEKIVKALGGADNEVFIILAFLQVLFVSFSYSICTLWLKKRGLAKVPLLIISLFFATCPILNLYMVTIIKDVPFAIGTLLIIPMMYEIWESKGDKLSDRSFLIKFMACTVLFFFRSNGVIVCVLLTSYLMIAYKKYIKSVLAYLTFVFMLIGMTKLVQNVAHAPYRFREAVGIPIQQIAATVCSNGEITEEQYSFIDRLLPIEEIKNNYDPYNVDTLKYGSIELDSDFLNENKREFLKVWGQLLFKNTNIYIDSYLRTTYGFWSFSNNNTKMRYTYIGAFADQFMYYDWMESENIKPKSILPSDIQTACEELINSISFFLGAGVMAWLILCIMAALVLKYGWSILIVGLPSILCWATLLISTPIAFQWRYALSFAYALPILYGISMIKQ